MRLDFNILWVDDQQDYIQTQKERIELLLSKEGFNLKVLFSSSVDKAVEYLSSDIYGDHIDLILMDYDLGAGGRGDVGLSKAREIFQYKDIVFYSSQAQDLYDMVTKHHIEGVYCSTRNDLPDTVDGIFDSLVKKVLDIDHSRGIVLGATSDIDSHVNECLCMLFDIADKDNRDKIIKKLKSHLDKQEKSFSKSIDELRGIDDLSDIKDGHYNYSSSYRLRLLKNTVKFLSEFKDKEETITSYLNDTVPVRNLLAHVRVEEDGFSRKLLDKSGKEFTNDRMRELRIDLMKYHYFMEGFLEDLKAR